MVEEDDLLYTNPTLGKKGLNLPTPNSKMKTALRNKDTQAVLNLLTYKQRRFVEEYLVDLNSAQAVLRAGYQTTPTNAKIMGSNLLKSIPVKYCVDALLAQRNKSTAVNKDYVLRKIVKTLEAAEGDDNHSIVLRAAELLGKHLALFVERTEVSGPDGEAIKYEKAKEDADDLESAITRLSERTGTKRLASVA